MNIPLSSSLPDPVQKLLGFPGGSGDIKEMLLGAAACVLLSWGLLTLVKKMSAGKKP